MTRSTRLRRVREFVFLLIFALGALVASSPAQISDPSPYPSPSPSPAATPAPSLEKHFFTNLLKDQYGIWTFPLRLHKDDWKWGVPLAAASIVLLNTDEPTSHALHYDKTRNDISKAISLGGSAYATVGSAIGIYAVGRATHNARARETGILSLEALINNGIVTQVVKTVAQRPRPLEDNGEGEFFVHGSSFFSGHSSSIWTLAAVVNDEYGKRHPWARYGMFGLATAVSLSRYTGQKHFLGDILIGSAVGYGIGHFVYLKHHDENLDQTSGPKSMTRLEKYFPQISAGLDHKTRGFQVAMAWNF